VTNCQSKSVFDGIAAITVMITVHRAQQNLHHRQKSTSSRYYRLTRLHVRSIEYQAIDSTGVDSVDRLDFSAYRSTGSIDSIHQLDRFQGLDRITFLKSKREDCTSVGPAYIIGDGKIAITVDSGSKTFSSINAWC